MSTFNKIIIVGFLGRDPELTYTPAGTAICKFSIATTERRKKGEEMEEITTWFRCTCWGRQAETAEQYLSKGSKVYLEGKLHNQEFVDREGKTRSSLEVNVNELQFLSSKKESGGQDASTGEEKREAVKKALGGQAAAGKRPDKSLLSIEEDDIPF